MKDKVVIITGSTSGIGFGIAKSFANKGAILIINGFATEDVVKKLSLELKLLGATDVFYHPADLSKPGEISDLFEKSISKFKKIDILVNNAGVQFVSPIEDFPTEKWEGIIRVDLIAAFYTIKSVIPLMKKNGWGRIVNIASAHALVASPFKSAYVAAKHGLLGLTKTVALELAEHNITVNAVCPGYVKTPLVLNQVADTARARGISEDDVIKKIILGAQATKKFVEIDEVAELVMFLCSDKAGSITGAALSIDGGWTAQ
jgi:3-hydroxybutyrate dehydrogenase